MYKKIPQGDKDRARILKNSGWTYYKISLELGYSWDTIKGWFDSDYTNFRNKKRNLLYNKEHKKLIRDKWLSNIISRCNLALNKSKIRSKEMEYTECISPVEILVDSFTGYCHICCVPEIECKIRLAMDHNHITGEFRGWLCHKCNGQILGGSNDNSDLLRRAANYLDGELKINKNKELKNG